MRIASLSYDGDFRMRVGEDRDKVATIVDAAKHRFGDMYLPLLTDDAEHVMMNDNGRIYQDGSPIAVYHHLNLLPRTVLVHIHEAANRRQKRNRDLEEVVFSLAHRHDYASIVAEAIRTIVARSSIRQTIKNAITAGAYNSVVYAMRKVGRMVRSRLR
jgi:translocator assembly and maintenance protein 41